MAGERALPGLGLFGFWTLGSNGWKDQHDSNLRLLSALVQPRVLSFVAAVPGSPTDGDMHVLTNAPNQHAIAIRDLGAWVYVTPAEGWTVYDRTTNTLYQFTGTEWVPMLPMPAGGGDVGKVLTVNGAGTGLELQTPASAPTSIPVKTESASYTLVLLDAGKYIRMDVGTANDLIVPANSSVAFPVGTIIHLRQAGAGQTTIVEDTGVTITTAETLKIRGQHSSASLVKVSTNTWELTGDLEAAP